MNPKSNGLLNFWSLIFWSLPYLSSQGGLITPSGQICCYGNVPASVGQLSHQTRDGRNVSSDENIAMALVIALPRDRPWLRATDGLYIFAQASLSLSKWLWVQCTYRSLRRSYTKWLCFWCSSFGWFGTDNWKFIPSLHISLEVFVSIATTLEVSKFFYISQ